MEKKLKVLHICTTDGGGAGLCCLRIHKALLGQGIDSKVLTLNKTSKDVPEVYQYGKINEYGNIKGLILGIFLKIMYRCKIKINDYSRVYGIGSLPLSFFDVTKHPLIQWADIIHLHWIDNFIDYPSFFRNIKKPIVWTLHDEILFSGIYHSSVDERKYDKLDKKYYGIKEKAIHSAKNLGLVFLSENMENMYHNHSMVQGLKTTIIHNPIDYKAFKPVDKKLARKKLNIPLNATVFSFVSNSIIDPRKGLHLLSETLKRIKLPLIYILAVGDYYGYKEMQYVHPIGMIHSSDDMSIAYSSSDFLVMPSLMESFGQTPLEAMSCGVPAIVFPTGISKELITPQNGVCAKGFSSEDLETAIRKAITCKYDSNVIRQDVINRFSPENIANKYISFYADMLNN